MALLRAEIRNRLGDSSIYDGIVEYQDDFQNEPMLDSMHYGSMMLCLNYTENQSTEPDPSASDLYVKREDGSWERVITVTKGTEGESAYDVAVDNGFSGTEQEWLASLVGEQGTTFTPSVSNAGVLSWTNDGNKQNPASVDLAAAIASSGSVSPLFVAFSKSNNNVWSADKDISEVWSAYTAHRPIFFTYSENAAEAIWVEDPVTNYFVTQMVCKESGHFNHYKFQMLDGYGVSVSVSEIGGGSVTPESVATAIGDMTSAQAAQALDDLGGEPEKFVVTVTYDDQTDSYSADKTFAEIETAYNAKKTVIVLLPALNNTELQLSSLYPFDGGYGNADFYGIMPPAGVYKPTIIGVSVESDGQSDTWNYTEFAPQEGSRGQTIFGTTPTIEPVANTIYNCGTLTSLTISNPPATGEYEIDFISGATPTVCAFDDIRWPDNTAPTVAANTEYEISVKNNKGLCVGWPVQSGGGT